MALKLKSIDEEAAACQKAFKDFPIGGYSLHCHHEIVGETLREDAANRIDYILTQKPEHERALRLRLFRPVSEKKLKQFKQADAAWQQAYAARQQAYAARQQAYAARQQAYAARQQAYAARQQTYAAWQQAYAAWQQADAAWQQADAAWQQADAALGEKIHKKLCVKGCPWNGKTIFPNTR